MAKVCLKWTLISSSCLWTLLLPAFFIIPQTWQISVKSLKVPQGIIIQTSANYLSRMTRDTLLPKLIQHDIYKSYLTSSYDTNKYHDYCSNIKSNIFLKIENLKEYFCWWMHKHSSIIGTQLQQGLLLAIRLVYVQ